MAAETNRPIPAPNGSQIKVVNYIRFLFLGFIPFQVILLGKVFGLDADERTRLRAKYGTDLGAGTVKAVFQSPILVFLNRLSLSVGPTSSVVLDTPYLSSRVRLGLGSRGSKFVFTRTEAKEADLWRQNVDRSIPVRKLAVPMLLASVAAAVLRAFKATWILAGFGLLFALSRGGIEPDDADDTA
jgi:hypothetical protein